jgi:hypothetical protein
MLLLAVQSGLRVSALTGLDRVDGALERRNVRWRRQRTQAAHRAAHRDVHSEHVHLERERPVTDTYGAILWSR